MIPKTLRIRISTRLFALLLACNLIPFFAIINILQTTSYATDDPAILFAQLRSDIFLNSFIFMGAGLFLTTMVSLNLQRPFREIIQVLRAVRHGQFDQKVQVTSNDEIGYTGDVINEMTEGLNERDRMRQSLELAKEVQQNLIPQSDPKITGLDIAGQSIYCEKTGGDYYDYLLPGKPEDGKIGIVVGDVSGHGIPSALLMAAVRSALRQRILMPGDIAQIISDVNKQLTKDVEESARFMTLFYSEIDAQNRCIRWVRAGHDPAILYDPEFDLFKELKGSGVALGVDEGWRFEENIKEDLKNNQIIVICTDGVWEAHNATGDMFGKESLYQLIRSNSEASAMEIADAVVAAVKKFQKGVEPEDDVTLVVIKIV
jgi:sigma-B regulation protein RsbU (phosphoserine phosphatase)